MRFQYVANRGICFYHRFFGDVARRDEPLSLSYCGSRFRSDDFHYALYAESLRSGLFLVVPRAAPRLGGVVGTLYTGHGGAEPFRKLEEIDFRHVEADCGLHDSFRDGHCAVFPFFVTLTREILPHWWANALCGVVTLLCIAPFLRGIMARGRRSSLFQALWKESRYNRLPLVFTLIVRAVVVCMLIFYIIRFLVPFADPLLLLLALLIVGGISLSSPLRRNSIRMEKVFMDNLHSRDMLARRDGKVQPGYAERLLSKDLHLADFEVPEESIWGGRLLSDLKLGQRYEVHVVSIIRGTHYMNIPNGNDRIYPRDHIQVIGTDEQIERFSGALANTVIVEAEYQDREMQLKQFLITEVSGFVGVKIKNSGIRDRYHCMIVGIETPDGILEKPEAERVFRVGDIIWLVGEKEALSRLFSGKP